MYLTMFCGLPTKWFKTLFFIPFALPGFEFANIPKKKNSQEDDDMGAASAVEEHKHSTTEESPFREDIERIMQKSGFSKEYSKRYARRGKSYDEKSMDDVVDKLKASEIKDDNEKTALDDILQKADNFAKKFKHLS